MTLDVTSSGEASMSADKGEPHVDAEWPFRCRERLRCALEILVDTPEPLTISQLAHEVLAKQPTVTKLVQRMGEQGWVTLQDDPGDQRRTLVSVTAAGRKLVKPLVQQARQHEARVLRSLASAEKAALRRLLEKLRQQA